MPQFVPIFLTIHILTAIAAFGPVFVFPVIASMAAREPQHGLFALKLTDRLERRLVIPLALTMPISGGLLAWSEDIDPTTSHWLGLAIALYVVAVAFAIVVQVRTVDRMIEIAGLMVAGGPVLAAGPGAALARPDTAGAAATGRAATGETASKFASPAAEMAALGFRARNGGIFLTVMVVVIVSLMAGKPSI